MRASASLTTSLRFLTPKPSGGLPPIHMPFFLEAAILSRIRSPVTSRSNWAKDSSTLSVSRPIEVVVLNCLVTETTETEAGVDLAHDCLSRQAAAVRTGTHPAIHFGRDDHLVAAGGGRYYPCGDALP